MFGFLAQLLNWCYTIWTNYLGMVVIFTLILMVVITPFTVKGMRSAAEMSRLQPEIKKIQDANKNDRLKQNEEMQALFKEHGVNPLGGCLPTLLPLPIFFVVFRLLERLNGHKTGAAAPMVRLVRGQVGGSGGYVAPHYLAYHDKLTQHIIQDGGHLKAFGMDLSLTARAHHSSVAAAIPFYVLIIVMTVSQYWQQRQINQRNPAAANANPQMKMTMQLFPAFYALISLNIPATVVFYLLISGVYRMTQNSLSYRYDPVLRRAMQPIPAGAGSGGADGAIDAKSRPKGPAPLSPAKQQSAPPAKQQSAPSAKGQSAPTAKGQPAKAQQAGRKAAASVPAAAAAKPGGFMERLRAQAAEAKAQAERSQQERAAKASGGARTTSGQSGGRTTPSSGPASPGRAQGRGSTPATSVGNGKSGTKPKPAPSPAPEAKPAPRPAAEAPTPTPVAEAPSPAAAVDAQITAAEAEIAAEEAAIDADIDAAAVEPVPEPQGDAGNGTPPSRGSSPLRVSRPSGRGTPPKGRRPKPGQ
jgi:YidC/Oxa1 family membrane protein insertase